MNIYSVKAKSIPDLWFQAVRNILDHGRKFIVNMGSYTGQQRLEYDYFIGHIEYPGSEPIIPDINPSLGIPNPVDYNYIFGGKNYERSYIEYLMTDTKNNNESYTYGERLTKTPIDHCKNLHDFDFRLDGKVFFKRQNKIYVNQIEWIIKIYKEFGFRNNQLVLQIARPSDILLQDPPCLRHIDTRIQDGKLNFFVYFRSWDLWSGLPANLAAIQVLKNYMASEINVKDGVMIVESKGLHLYGYAEKLAKLRCLKE